MEVQSLDEGPSCVVMLPDKLNFTITLNLCEKKFLLWGNMSKAAGLGISHVDALRQPQQKSCCI